MCCIAKDGRAFWAESQESVIIDRNGASIGYVHIYRDVTERRRIIDALRASELLYRATFDHAAIGIAHVSQDGHWLRVNRKFCEILGYEGDDLKRIRFQDLSFPEDLDSDMAKFAQIFSREIQTCVCEKRFIRRDERTVWTSVTASSAPDGNGPNDYVILIVEDLTDRKEAEQKLRALRKDLEHLTRFQVASFGTGTSATVAATGAVASVSYRAVK